MSHDMPDLVEIARIRRVLLSQKQAHGKGVQWLSDQISHTNSGIVPRRTLARFLAGKEITPLAVKACSRYAEKLPSKPLATDLLAEALKGFFFLSPPSMPPGNYRVEYTGNLLSNVVLTQTPGFMSILENLRPVGRFTGILLASGHYHYALLREVSTRYPRWHVIDRGRTAAIDHYYPHQPRVHIEGAEWVHAGT